MVVRVLADTFSIHCAAGRVRMWILRAYTGSTHAIRWYCSLTTRWSGRAGLKNMINQGKRSVLLPRTNRPPPDVVRPLNLIVGFHDSTRSRLCRSVPVEVTPGGRGFIRTGVVPNLRVAARTTRLPGISPASRVGRPLV